MEIKQPHVPVIYSANTEIDIDNGFLCKYVIGKRASRYAGVNYSEFMIISRAHVIIRESTE